MRVIVVGGSIAGLAAGLGLSRAGHDVTIIERDAQPLPESPEAAAISWRRGGVPQVRQSHGFVCRLRTDLLANAPDVWFDLLDAGALELRLLEHAPQVVREATPEQADDELAFLLCRRTTFEWVLRCAVEKECSLMLGERVESLLVDDNARGGRVRGVATSTAEMRADLVVDASGRFGRLLSRQTEDSRPALPTADESCGIVYASRFYRLRRGADWGPLNRLWAAGGTYGGYACVLFPHDADTFSVNFGRLPSDSLLAAAHTTEGFTRAVARVPFVAEWVDADRAEPNGPPIPMAGIRNMLTPQAGITGLISIGDSVCTTDPAFGRGAAIAVSSAFALVRAVQESAGDLRAAHQIFDEWFAEQVAPWHADSVAQDRGRTAMWEGAVGGSSGQTTEAGGGSRTVTPALIAAAGMSGAEPAVWRAFVRYAGMLALPSSLFTDDVLGRVNGLVASGWSPPAITALDHREMAAVAANA